MRILFLTPDFPHPPDSGGRIKTGSILAYLRRRHEVRVLCFRRRDLTPEQDRWTAETGAVESLPLARGRNPLNLLRSYVSGVPLSIERNRDSRMRRAVSRAVREGAFDAVFVDGWLMAQYLPSDFSGLKLLHEHNAEYVMWVRQATLERNPVRWPLVQLEYRRVRRYEAAILPGFDAVFAVSEEDRRALLDLGADPARLRVLPNLPDPALLDLPPLSFEAAGPVIFYFGTLNWQPNLEGLVFLIRSVLPLIREQLPEARLLVAGRDAPPWLPRLVRSAPGAEVLGPLDDAEPYYRRARVFIEATRSGGGTKLKVLNALARGLPVAATPEAAAGIDAAPGEHLLVASDARALTDAAAQLLTDSALWQRVSANGRELIRKRYIAEVAFTPLDEVLSGAGATA